MPKTIDQPDSGLISLPEAPQASPPVRRPVPLVRWIGWMVVIVIAMSGMVWLATSDVGEPTAVVAESDGSFEVSEADRLMRLAPGVDGFEAAELSVMLRLAPVDGFQEAELSMMMRLAPEPDGFDAAEFERMQRLAP